MPVLPVCAMVVVVGREAVAVRVTAVETLVALTRVPAKKAL